MLLFIMLSAVMAVHEEVSNVCIHFNECNPVPASRNRPQGFSPWLLTTELNNTSPIPVTVTTTAADDDDGDGAAGGDSSGDSAAAGGDFFANSLLLLM